ncbi:replication-relaxation family protein [Solibacillus sp. FSL R7-0682]|uniref:replication-relaxation family protein n=1 Tax=Solibacillus sp. FSL R7-0682 TaxID=2921690 RepID=UPI0030F721F6
MSIIHDYRLTHCSMKILAFLMYYRGMTALQLTQMYYEVQLPLNTQKSSIHNYLSKLKNQGLVASKKVNDPLHPGSLYWLTTLGLDTAKDLLNIDIGAAGTGYIFSDDNQQQSQADLPYEIYAPPKMQVEHHLSLIDFFNILRWNFFEDEHITHRLSMYCSVEYSVGNKQTKIRPDAEIVLPNGDIYWIEIDKATESHSKLLNKFNNYKHYFDYLKQQKLPLPMKAILFVTDTKQHNGGVKRRWSSLLSAYLKVMHTNDVDVRLLLTPLNKLEQTLRFEMQRKELEVTAKQFLSTKAQLEDYPQMQRYSKLSSEQLLFALAINNNAYKIIYANISNTFDSSAYTNFQQFLTNEARIKKKNEVQKLKFQGLERIIFYQDDPPQLLQRLHGSENYPEIEDLLKQLSSNIEFVELIY